MMETLANPVIDQELDFMPILGTDYVEFYVSNAKQAAHFYRSAFGFKAHAYAGLETGLKDRQSYVVIQDKIRVILGNKITIFNQIAHHC